MDTLTRAFAHQITVITKDRYETSHPVQNKDMSNLENKASGFNVDWWVSKSKNGDLKSPKLVLLVIIETVV